MCHSTKPLLYKTQITNKVSQVWLWYTAVGPAIYFAIPVMNNMFPF